MDNTNYLFHIPNRTNMENIRLSNIANTNCLYFYISYPIRNSENISLSDSYELPPPPTPELRREPGSYYYYYTSPNYLLNLSHKVLCKAILTKNKYDDDEHGPYYDVYYLSYNAPPQIILFENPGKWLSCTWRLYPNGDIHYFVKKSIGAAQFNHFIEDDDGQKVLKDSHYHYINKYNDNHIIIRVVYRQLLFCICKFKILLFRARNRIKIRLFILNTHTKSSSILNIFNGNHWSQVRHNIYNYIKY